MLKIIKSLKIMLIVNVKKIANYLIPHLANDQIYKLKSKFQSTIAYLIFLKQSKKKLINHELIVNTVVLPVIHLHAHSIVLKIQKI
jgi:hypothetical protein